MRDEVTLYRKVEFCGASRSEAGQRLPLGNGVARRWWHHRRRFGIYFDSKTVGVDVGSPEQIGGSKRHPRESEKQVTEVARAMWWRSMIGTR